MVEMYPASMGSTKLQLIFTVILVYQINSIDTREHAEQHPAVFRRTVDGGGGYEGTTATPSADANHSHAAGELVRSGVSSETIGLSKQGAKNSFTGNESADFWPRLRRSVGGSATTGQTGSQSLCNKEGCSCLDQPILTIDCEVHDREVRLSNINYYSIGRLSFKLIVVAVRYWKEIQGAIGKMTSD